MQRFVNNPDYVVEDMLKGFLKAHDDLIVKNETNDRVVQYKNTPVEGKVGLVTGGGSGHERIPWLCGRKYDGCGSCRRGVFISVCPGIL